MRLTTVSANTTVMLARVPDGATLNTLHSLGLLSTRPFRVCSVSSCCVIVQSYTTRIGIARHLADTINVNVLDLETDFHTKLLYV